MAEVRRYSWWKHRNGAIFLVVGIWYGSAGDQIETLQYSYVLPAIMPKLDFEKLIENGDLKPL